MKPIALFAFSLFLIPSLALAQQTPPPGGPPPPDAAGGPMGTPSPQRMAAMRQVGEQMKALHEQARAQMLGALTPQHRAALANLVGQAAIAPNPDPRVVAQRIDALLTPAEARSVLAVAATERTSGDNIMEAARAQFEATLTPDQQAAMKAREQQRASRFGASGRRPNFTSDPGRELLRAAFGFAGGGMHGGPGGPMGEPHP